MQGHRVSLHIKKIVPNMFKFGKMQSKILTFSSASILLWVIGIIRTLTLTLRSFFI